MTSHFVSHLHVRIIVKHDRIRKFLIETNSFDLMDLLSFILELLFLPNPSGLSLILQFPKKKVLDQPICYLLAITYR